QPIEPMQLPTVQAVNERRVAKFLGRIDEVLEGDELAPFRELVERYEREHDVPAIEIAAALARLVQGKTPLLLEAREEPPPPPVRPRREGPAAVAAPTARGTGPDVGMVTYRIEVGHRNGVQPGNIVGAIANEAELESRYIGRIDIRDDFSLVDLPEGMPPELLQHLQKVRVGGQPLRMRLADPADLDAPPASCAPSPPAAAACACACSSTPTGSARRSSCPAAGAATSPTPAPAPATTSPPTLTSASRRWRATRPRTSSSWSSATASPTTRRNWGSSSATSPRSRSWRCCWPNARPPASRSAPRARSSASSMATPTPSACTPARAKPVRRRWWSPAAASRSRAWVPRVSATSSPASSATRCFRRVPGWCR